MSEIEKKQEFEAIFGRLYSSETNDDISYCPMEISKFQIGLVSPSKLHVGDFLKLAVSFEQNVELEIIDTHDASSDGSLFFYQIAVKNLDVDLEKLLDKPALSFSPDGDSIHHVRKLNKTFLRAARFDVDHEMIIETSTFGSAAPYEMFATNLSKSGILLTPTPNCGVPYIVDTIVELKLDSKQTWLEKSIKCLGKVVRILKNDQGKRYGLKIVQIEEHDFEIWTKLVEQLEHRNAVAGSQTLDNAS